MLKDFRAFILRGNLVDLAVVFFFVVKPVNAMLERFKQAETEAPEAPSPETALLTEIRDLLREQRGAGAGAP